MMADNTGQTDINRVWKSSPHDMINATVAAGLCENVVE